ncbi:MAG TPA: DUF1420 family protein [Candidatus Acidoferrum sp.]|nr:DUF1420 family protein [Candidatus Acidoferrum sp.]
MSSLLFVPFALALFVFLAAALGIRALRLFSISFDQPAERLLFSSALGTILLQVLFFLSQFTGRIRTALVAILLVTGAAALFGFAEAWSDLRKIFAAPFTFSPLEKSLSALIAAALLLQFLVAMAPLTASDALHYHFAVPKVILSEGAAPNFFLSHSFFCGQGHSLILFGLAFGSEQLATGSLFLGGVLSAFALFVLAKNWLPRVWALLAVLLFLLSPLVAWQISAGGAPDLWMAFFATAAVLLAAKLRETNSWKFAALAGVLAGGIAGIKYTGCYVAAALALALLVESRSLLRTAIFSIAAVFAGIAPYLRNLLWTGDPFFPFLLPKLNPAHVNAYALSYYLADTGASGHHTVLQLLRYVTFSWIDPARVGFWQFFGPIVLAFLPFLFFAVRNTALWRVTLLVWSCVGLALGVSSSMPRFLLVIYPVVLAAIVAGIFSAFDRQSKPLRLIVSASLLFFVAGSAAGFVAYSARALPAPIGLKTKEQYLREAAPDYQAAEFVNQTLAGASPSEKALVFFRHVYFLQVPYLYGDPQSSWAMDPAKFRTAADWTAFFQRNSIRWVVRTSDSNDIFSDSFNSMISDGTLTPFAQTAIDNFQGMRSAGIRGRSTVAVFLVNAASGRSLSAAVPRGPENRAPLHSR